MVSYVWLGEVGKMEWLCSRMEVVNFKLNFWSYEIFMIGYGEVGVIVSMSECFY